MPYADTDFFLALIKENDWLSERAEKILRTYKNEIWTSSWTLVELLMLSKEFGLNPENITISIKNLAKIEGDINGIISAAHLMKEKNMKTFDALHAMSCGKDRIISSDSVFDKIGMDRIHLG